MRGFDVNAYDSVDSRIDRFWNDHPNGRILTRCVNYDAGLDELLFLAEVYENREDERPAATGWACEKRGSGGANNTHHAENSETSAIGRALANFNYKTRKESPRPSREEMTREQRYEQRQPEPKYHAATAQQPAQNEGPALYTKFCIRAEGEGWDDLRSRDGKLYDFQKVRNLLLSLPQAEPDKKKLFGQAMHKFDADFWERQHALLTQYIADNPIESEPQGDLSDVMEGPE